MRASRLLNWAYNIATLVNGSIFFYWFCSGVSFNFGNIFEKRHNPLNSCLSLLLIMEKSTACPKKRETFFINLAIYSVYSLSVGLLLISLNFPLRLYHMIMTGKCVYRVWSPSSGHCLASKKTHTHTHTSFVWIKYVNNFLHHPVPWKILNDIIRQNLYRQLRCRQVWWWCDASCLVKG